MGGHKTPCARKHDHAGHRRERQQEDQRLPGRGRAAKRQIGRRKRRNRQRGEQAATDERRMALSIRRLGARGLMDPARKPLAISPKTTHANATPGASETRQP